MKCNFKKVCAKVFLNSIDPKKYNYSRSERLKRALQKEGDKVDQPSITYFFKYIDNIGYSCEKNKSLNMSLPDYTDTNSDVEKRIFLKNILKSLTENGKKKTHMVTDMNMN